MADRANIAMGLRARAENAALRATVLHEMAAQEERLAEALGRHAEELGALDALDATVREVTAERTTIEKLTKLLDGLEQDKPHAGTYGDALQDLRVLVAESA